MNFYFPESSNHLLLTTLYLNAFRVMAYIALNRSVSAGVSINQSWSLVSKSGSRCCFGTSQSCLEPKL